MRTSAISMGSFRAAASIRTTRNITRYRCATWRTSSRQCVTCLRSEQISVARQIAVEVISVAVERRYELEVGELEPRPDVAAHERVVAKASRSLPLTRAHDANGLAFRRWCIEHRRLAH